MAQRIKQLMPADRWMAVYLTDVTPYFTLVRLVGWALTEREDGSTDPNPHLAIRGVDARRIQALEFSPDTPGFFGYVHESEITQDLRAFWSLQGKQTAGQT